MEKLKGKGVSKGIAIGKLQFYTKKKKEIPSYTIEDVNSEIQRFTSARKQATEHLQKIYENALKRIGEKQSFIFQVHQMMLNDLDFTDIVMDTIANEKKNAEYSVDFAAKQLFQMFTDMSDPYMKARAIDIIDASNKLLDILSGVEDSEEISKPIIIGAQDLMPSETIKLNKELLLGFITNEGASNSHTAILARTIGIPAVIKISENLEQYDGKTVIIDGETGDVFVSPDKETLLKYEKISSEYKEYENMLKTLVGEENESLNGQKIKIYANIGSIEDVLLVNENDAGGIGLFRSEFLYLGKDSYPTEKELFTAYKEVVQKCGKHVIIRTLDIGADKKVDYFELPKEENPAMGFRAIRICLEREGLFKTQLRAILKASAFGKLAIMFPMITSLLEVQKIKKIVSDVMKELEQKEIYFDKNIELGIMIETPAAALISDELAQEVDFFSVGTNDLTQYTLAIDRQNQKLESFYNPHHKAVLRMIKMAADNAHAKGKWIGICGELAADTSLTKMFLAMGIDELSVVPTKILEIRKIVRETDAGNKNEILKGI